MATTTALCTSYKVELFKGLHNHDASGGDAYKMALIKSAPTGTYDATTTNYSDITGNTDEVTGTGYTVGGAAITNVDPTSSGTTAYIDQGDVEWTSATFTASACMCYNDTNGDRSAYVHDFGGDQTVTAGTFTITMPAAGPTTAIIRID